MAVRRTRKKTSNGSRRRRIPGRFVKAPSIHHTKIPIPIPPPPPPPPPLPQHSSLRSAPLGLDWGCIPMNPNGDLLSRCPKHPSQPPFTGFCSACLLERLSAASLPSPSPCSAPAHAAVSEITPETQTCTRLANPRPTRTTLLYLFHLDDMANGSTSAAAHQQRDLSQSLPSQGEQGQGDPPLQRKRSLRQPCDWIVCCDAANESWDGSAGAAPQLVLDRRRNKASLSSWNQVWEPLRGFVNKPAHILLRRSLSESWSINGSRPPVSSAGRMDSEISSLAEDSAIDADAGRDSLLKRLYWLGRSRSRTQGRRLSLFATTTTTRHQQQ